MSSPDRIGQSAFRVHILDADIQIHGTRSQALSPSPPPTPRAPRESLHAGYMQRYTDKYAT